MAPPKNPPAKKTPAKKPAAGVVGAIGTVANIIADKVPNAQKDAQRKMRGKPMGGATRG